LKVSKPSTGASFQAPPKAEIQPKKLPMVTTTRPRDQLAPKACSTSSRSRRACKFDPWDALADHRPVGEIMRARKAAYFASQKERGAA